MGEIGMDPQAVLAIARKLDEQSQRVTTVASTVDRLVAEARGIWQGSDVAKFAAQWSGHRAQLRTAGSALKELATKARTNAEQQIRTSNEYGGVGGGATGTVTYTAAGGVDYTLAGGSVNGSTTIGGVPVSGGAGYNVGYGASGNAHLSYGPNGLNAGANGEFHDGVQGQAHGQIGSGQWRLNGDASGKVGLFGDGSASIVSNANGTTIDAHGEVLDGAQVQGTLTGHTPFGSQTITGQATAGASADGHFNEYVGDKGFSTSFGGDASLGASESVSGSQTVGPFTVNSGIGADQGLAAGGGGDVSVTPTDVGFDVNGDLAAALGLKADLGVHVNPTALVNDLGGDGSIVGDTFSTGYHAITGVFSGL